MHSIYPPTSTRITTVDRSFLFVEVQFIKQSPLTPTPPSPIAHFLSFWSAHKLVESSFRYHRRLARKIFLRHSVCQSLQRLSVRTIKFHCICPGWVAWWISGVWYCFDGVVLILLFVLLGFCACLCLLFGLITGASCMWSVPTLTLRSSSSHD